MPLSDKTSNKETTIISISDVPRFPILKSLPREERALLEQWNKDFLEVMRRIIETTSNST